VSGNASSTIVFPVPMSLLQTAGGANPAPVATDDQRVQEALEAAKVALEATSGARDRSPA
jgi:hypothetical protein